MTRTSASAPTPTPRRRGFIVTAAVAAILVLVVAALLFVWLRPHGAASTRPDWKPPVQTFLTASMRVQPVPGWRSSATDLGLPKGSRLASSDDPYWSQAFIGYLGGDGYFLATSPGPTGPQWWLVGVDVAAGKRLFTPVRLDEGPSAPKCFLNGPDAVLCLRDDVQSATAWVIDASTGSISFTGPTELRTPPGDLGVRQIGDYAIAETINQGVYGVGPDARTTWFVPGKGSTGASSTAAMDVPPQLLATQATKGSDQMTVFSLVDGSVITPGVEQGRSPLSAAVYPGGFAVEVTSDDSQSLPDGIEFFDDKGRRLAAVEASGFLSTTGTPVPIVETAPQSAVFSADGVKLAEISRFGPGDSALLIGNRLFVEERDGETRWQEYNLRSGAKGQVCKPYLGGYVGGEENTGVFESGNPNVGLVTKGMDLATCDVLWQIESPVGSFRDVWRIKTTLVQLSDDGTELMSLVAPR